MDLIELAKIEEALRCDKITYIEAGQRVYRPATKLWQTEDWRKKSSELLKDSCEQCGMKNVPMVLQQTWYPSPYRKLEQMVYGEFLEEQIAAGSFPEVRDEEVQRYLDQFTEMKRACPLCNSINTKKRKQMKPAYRCTRCHHDFDEPKMVAYDLKLGVAPSFDEVKREMTDRQWRSDIWNQYGEDLKKRTVLKGIEEHKRYLALKDTKTLCRECAFLWEKKRKKICRTCKEALIPIQLEACYDCQKGRSSE